MKRREDNGYRAWRRRRLPRPRFKPNDTFLREYEEAVILADCRRLHERAVAISSGALRDQEPGRYSIKLALVLRRMARRGGPLTPNGSQRHWRVLTPTYQLADMQQERAA